MHLICPTSLTPCAFTSAVRVEFESDACCPAGNASVGADSATGAASHAISHTYVLANAVPDPDFPAARTHAYTYPIAAISFYLAYLAYFDTYTGGISMSGYSERANCKELFQRVGRLTTRSSRLLLASLGRSG